MVKSVVHVSQLFRSVVFVNDFESTKEAGKMDVLQGRHQMALFEPRGYAGSSSAFTHHAHFDRMFVSMVTRRVGPPGREGLEGDEAIHSQMPPRYGVW